jgi:hypothetical protein
VHAGGIWLVNIDKALPQKQSSYPMVHLNTALPQRASRAFAKAIEI